MVLPLISILMDLLLQETLGSGSEMLKNYFSLKYQSPFLCSIGAWL
jgi:hypothetical protein